jgi:hypothetical protein
MAIKRRKPAAERKALYLRARVTEAHLAEFQDAARDAGISVSAWTIDRLLRAARQERKARGSS